MSTAREILDTISKQDLIDLIIKYSDNGYFPIDLFLMKANQGLTAGDIENHWNGVYEKALEYMREENELCADYLRDGAELCFEQAKNLSDQEECKILCREISDDLTTAAEKDGIGMNTDSEWLYLEVREKINDYIVDVDVK